MLSLGGLKHLAAALGVSLDSLMIVLDDFDEHPESLVRELTIWPADQRKKPRDVICAIGQWRFIQKRIYLKLLRPSLRPTRHMHGGVSGRNPSTNARAHFGNAFAFVTDIARFFPSIKCRHINRIFLNQGCGPKVAGVLTRLCTYDFHLAQGLMTSPILANEVFKEADRHIVNACKGMGLVYTRYVDDITISGRFDLSTTPIESVVRKIVKRYGFELAGEKTRFGTLDGDICITGARISGDHLNPSPEFLRELQRLIADHISLASGGPFEGPLLMEGELFGKAQHAFYLNPGLRRSILAKMEKIDWDAVMNNAVRLNLCRQKERITSRGAERPSSDIPLSLSQGRESVQLQEASYSSSSETAPWE